MKLHADRLDGPNAITRHGPGGILVNGVEHRSSSIVPWLGEVTAWPVDHFAQLTQAHFTTLAQWKPELIIFGSGERLRFVAPALMRTLIDAGIGVETMDTAAACRTYNVLFSEGRAVIAALLIEAAGRLR